MSKYSGFVKETEDTFLQEKFNTQFVNWMKANEIHASVFVQYDKKEVLDYLSGINGFRKSFKFQIQNYYQ